MKITTGVASDKPVVLPSGLDPYETPVIAEHFYGWRALSDVAAIAVYRAGRLRSANDAGVIEDSVA